MSLRFVAAALSVLLLGFSVCAQLPRTQKLSVEDEREFSKELERLERLLSTANNKRAVELQIANTYAAGGQFPEAIQRLRKVVGANLGFDSSRDPDFARLRDTAEFRSIMDEVRRQTPPVHNSRLIATLDDLDVRPENIGFDIKRNVFLLGNTAKFALVKCSRMGNCLQLVMPKAEDKGYGLGLKINRDSTAVWATYNTPEVASVRCYDLETGKLRRTASIKGKHVFNDLAISSTGDVYVTDTAEGSVYELPSEATTLKNSSAAYFCRRKRYRDLC
jgi:hypothetical protein